MLRFYFQIPLILIPQCQNSLLLVSILTPKNKFLLLARRGVGWEREREREDGSEDL